MSPPPARARCDLTIAAVPPAQSRNTPRGGGSHATAPALAPTPSSPSLDASTVLPCTAAWTSAGYAQRTGHRSTTAQGQPTRPAQVPHCDFYPETRPPAAIVFLPRRGGVQRLIDYAVDHPTAEVFIRSDALADEVSGTVGMPWRHGSATSPAPPARWACHVAGGRADRGLPIGLVAPDLWLQRGAPRPSHL